jgi:hypothetical protein
LNDKIIFSPDSRMGTCCSNNPNEHGTEAPAIKSGGKNIAMMHLNDNLGGEGFHNVSALPDITDATMKDVKKKLGEFKWDKIPKYTDPDIEQVGPVEYISNGAIYRGQMKGGKRHGAGVQVWKDGSRYEGEWRDDKANGYGRLMHADGDVYEGQWKNDTANGKGKYYHVQGAIYDGDWVDDSQQGHGKEEWPDGTYYEGAYVNGKKEGKGKFYWVDGSYYYGEFRDNSINGKGS